MTIQQKIDAAAERAHAEVKLLAAFARRSIGQRFRYMQVSLKRKS